MTFIAYIISSMYQFHIMMVLHYIIYFVVWLIPIAFYNIVMNILFVYFC